MPPVVTDGVAWCVSQSVCLSVCHDGEFSKNGSDRDAIWSVTRGGFKEAHIREGRHPRCEGPILREEWQPIVKYRDTIL